MADVEISFGADAAGFSKGLLKVQGELRGASGGMVSQLGSLGSAITGLGTLMNGVAASMSGLGSLVLDGMVMPAAQIESMRTAFGVLMGDADRAKEHLAELIDYSASTPFALEDIAAASKTLMAFGIDAQRTLSIIRTMGDVAALSGSSLVDMSAIIGKVGSIGKLDTEVANQMAERQIDLRGELAKMYDLSGTQVQSGIEAGDFGVEDLIHVLERVTSAQGLFSEGAAKASADFLGFWSTLKDNLSLAGATIGEGLLPALKSVMGELIEFLGAMKPLFADLGAAMGTQLLSVGEWLGGLLRDIASNRFEWQARLEVGIDYLAAVVERLAVTVDKLMFDPAGVVKDALLAIPRAALGMGQNDAMMELANNSRLIDGRLVRTSPDVSGGLAKNWDADVAERASSLRAEAEGGSVRAPAAAAGADEEERTAEAVERTGLALSEAVKQQGYYGRQAAKARDEVEKIRGAQAQVARDAALAAMSLREQEVALGAAVRALGGSGSGGVDGNLSQLAAALGQAGTVKEAQYIGALLKRGEALSSAMAEAASRSVTRDAELSALEAQAKGYTSKARAMEASIGLLEREAQLMEEGLDAADARAYAMRELRAQAAITDAQSAAKVPNRQALQQMVLQPSVRIGGSRGRMIGSGQTELQELRSQTSLLKKIEYHAGKLRSSQVAIMV